MINVEEILEKKKRKKDKNSFRKSFNIPIEKTNYIKEKNGHSKKKYKNYNVSTTKLKTVYVFVFIDTASTFVTLSINGFDFLVILISTGIDDR